MTDFCADWLDARRSEIVAWWEANRVELVDLRRDYHWPAKLSTKESLERRARVAAIVQRDARRGDLKRESLSEVLRWGFNNNDSALENSTDAQIRAATETALRLLKTNDLEGAVSSLNTLDGIGISSSSKMLALSDPERVVILDSRVGRALSGLTYDGDLLIPIPSGRGDPGSRSSPQELARGFAHLACLLQFLQELAAADPGARGVLSSVTDIEMALFMKGAR